LTKKELIKLAAAQVVKRELAKSAGIRDAVARRNEIYANMGIIEAPADSAATDSLWVEPGENADSSPWSWFTDLFKGWGS